ncbi:MULTISPECIES: hypothetical protein [Gammaproteobacteria]|uniref:hypothetical protein n=1 Tax=Gammaproteobacteria TaxID=1236 RepID=UPI000DD03C8D|nr:MULTISPECIES: hypothetical protein [Gammaproteobacteria]RTE86395.1 hypothetical protein DQX04_07485 [Aliidiomarina sp. B3213]TCZ91742.1 hypothetical protein EYQ95_07490 [Lysobacter sp. N42]
MSFNVFKWPQRNQQQYVYAVSVQKKALHLAILKSKKKDGIASSSVLSWNSKAWELVVNDEIEVANDNHAKALAKLLKRYDKFDFKQQPLQIVLSSAYVEQVSVDKPDVAEDDIPAALQWTLKDLVNIDAADMVVDYCDLPIQAGSENKIVAIAASRSFLQPLLDIIHEQKFDVQGIVNADVAFTYWFAPDERILALSQTQHESNELHIIAQQRLVLNRELTRITQIGKMSPENMDEVEQLALEIQRSLDFYTSQLRQAPLTQVVLATNHPQAPQIVDMVGAQLGMQSSVLQYPDWAKELRAGDFSDLAVLSGLLWLIAADSDAEAAA